MVPMSLVGILVLFYYLWGHLRKRYLLSRIPMLPSTKLTRESLMLAARDYSYAVRLPGDHGILVTSPALARRLLEAGSAGGVERDVAMYERYSGFLDGSLVLLPQSKGSHRALRAALLPLFSPTATRRLHATLVECAQRLVERLEAKAIPAPTSDADRSEIARRTPPAPVYRLLQQFVLDVTMRCFLATPADIIDADAKRLIALFEEWLSNPPPPPGRPPPSERQPWLARIAARMPWAPTSAASAINGKGSDGGGGQDSDEEDQDGADRLRLLFDAILGRLCRRQADTAAEAMALEAAAVEEAEENPSSYRRASSCALDASEPTPSVVPQVGIGRERMRKVSVVPLGPPPLPSVHSALADAGITDPEVVRAQTAGLLFAGLNSAKELSYAATLLANHPQLQADARAEVDAVLADQPPSYSQLTPPMRSSTVTDNEARIMLASARQRAELDEQPAPIESSASLELCARIVNETLRLSPGIEHLRLLTTRETTVPLESGSTSTNGGAESLTIPKDVRLVISISTLHRHPRHWAQPCDTPRPELFSPAAQATRSSGSFLPFSAGAKGCPAAMFALHEMRLMIAMLLQRFELLPARGGGVCVARRPSSTSS